MDVRFYKGGNSRCIFPGIKRAAVNSYYYALPQPGPASQLLPIFCGSAWPLVSHFKMWPTSRKCIFFAVKQVLMNHLGNGAASHEAGRNNGGNMAACSGLWVHFVILLPLPVTGNRFHFLVLI